MATGQDLLDTMELLDQELQLQPSEADVARGLIALNRSQDYFEMLATRQGLFKFDTNGTLTTSASTESTAFPTGLLRLDRLQFIDPTSSLPLYDIDPIYRTGGHIRSQAWPVYAVAVHSAGRPTEYWSNGRSIFWSPLPDATHTVRYYGFVAAANITADGTFGYDDMLILPVAAFATQLMKLGVGDSGQEVEALAQMAFFPTLDALSRTVRDGAVPMDYRYGHDT